jgi:hypothetical protein
MITNREIADAYLAYKHRKRTKGERIDNTLPLMPFFIMDACYQIYCKDIKDIPCRHLTKQAKKRWADAYHQFTTDFFAAFSPEQTDYIVDLMDRFNDYIHTNVVMLKSAVMNYFTDNTPFEDKKILGALLTCNVLAQSAQHMYGEMFRTGQKMYPIKSLKGVITMMPKEINPHLETIKKASFDFANTYPHGKGVDLTSSDKVMEMIGALCRKIVRFLNETENETNAS